MQGLVPAGLSRPSPTERLWPPASAPTPLNAAAENAAASTGRPLVAFPDQAHLAHIMTHMLFMDNQLLGEQGIGGPALIANMAEHLKQHITFQYVVLVRMIASEAAGKPIDSFMKQAEENPQLSAQIDQAIAAAATRAQHLMM